MGVIKTKDGLRSDGLREITAIIIISTTLITLLLHKVVSPLVGDDVLSRSRKSKVIVITLKTVTF